MLRPPLRWLTLPLLLLAACTEEQQAPTAPASEPALGVKPPPGLSFRQVSAGGSHTCGVTTGDVAYCWGANGVGQLGTGTSTGPERCTDFGSEFPCSTRPVRVVGGLAFRSVSAGGGHTCGVTTSNVTYCWGSNESGPLGLGTSTGRE